MKIGDFGIAQRAEELDAAISLIVPVFHEQPAARPEPVLRAHGNLPDAGKPILAADQGEARLEAQVPALEMGVFRRDVRRVGYDQIKLPRPERVKPVAENEVDFGPVVARVPPREGEGCLGNVRGDDPKPRPLARESDGDRTAARSELQHAPRLIRGKALERELDQEFGFRAGDQHVPGHPQCQAVELPPARNVGNGFASAPPGEPSARSTLLGRIDRFFGVGDERGALATQDRAKQHLGFQSRQSALAQQAAYRCTGSDRVHCGTLRQRSSANAASCSVWCSASSACVSWERSPSMISLILYSVRPIRWSVTLPCGKLYVRMRSERSPEPIKDLRVAACFACRSRRCLSLMRAASTASAFSLFLCCERASWHSTTIPVGRCVTRTAESVLLTCWPPAPEAR